LTTSRVRLDKSEGAVKDKDILGSAEHRFAREVEDQRLWKSHAESFFRRNKIVPPPIDSAETSAMILPCEHPVTTGCESAQSTFAV
jgi:hypothetical protein